MKSLSPTNAGSFGSFLKRCDLRMVVLLAALIVLFAAQGLAQEATIVGTVTDVSGAGDAVLLCGVSRWLRGRDDGSTICDSVLVSVKAFEVRTCALTS